MSITVREVIQEIERFNKEIGNPEKGDVEANRKKALVVFRDACKRVLDKGDYFHGDVGEITEARFHPQKDDAKPFLLMNYGDIQEFWGLVEEFLKQRIKIRINVQFEYLGGFYQKIKALEKAN